MIGMGGETNNKRKVTTDNPVSTLRLSRHARLLSLFGKDWELDFHAPASQLLEGSDPTPRIVAIELSGGNRVALYQRTTGGGLDLTHRTFQPWMLIADPAPFQRWRGVEIRQLSGSNHYRMLVIFPDWRSFRDARQFSRASNLDVYAIASPEEQFLVASGITLFKGMQFDQLQRLQLDIETVGLDASAEDARILMVALRWGNGRERVIVANEGEAILLDELSEAVRQIDPDVIEGHNIFNFDLPFIAERAHRLSRSLNWGRDGTPLRISEQEDRMTVGPIVHAYRGARVQGRHILDSYQQIQRYDVAGKLTSYGLKQSIRALGLEAPDRPIIPGDQIAEFWKNNRATLHEYALADVRDVARLIDLASPTEFYQTQMLPRTFQQTASTGSGSKINLLMLRAYIAAGASVPRSQLSRPYPGGHAEMLKSGIFSPVVKCDVESLYPSLMLAERISPSSDELGVFLPMLTELTARRRDAKARARAAVGADRAVWSGLQSSFKVLINSFYGYLGFNRALFNDYDAAERVTLAGQALVKDVVRLLAARGAEPIEVDTDGVYFVPPPEIRGEDEEQAFVDQIGRELPFGVTLAFDGRYRAMVSLKIKTYALLDYDDRIALTGSALRSRRLEPVFRDFLEDAARSLTLNDRNAVRDRYFDIADAIQKRRLRPEQISQWAMVRSETAARQPRLARLLGRSNIDVASGERILIYERDDGELALTEEYASDENVRYLLQRLHDTAARFETIFESEAALRHAFPAITPTTNIEAARTRPEIRQLNFF